MRRALVVVEMLLLTLFVVGLARLANWIKDDFGMTAFYVFCASGCLAFLGIAYWLDIRHPRRPRQ